jgi:uncharacterized protein YndB with AHSA1/START domain
VGEAGWDPQVTLTDAAVLLDGPVPHPIQVMWSAFTDADRLIEWWAPEATIDCRPGGTYVLRWPARNRRCGGSTER